ncbi:unnamed protein product [Ostreobium quekettii]|uniref:Uncharacterized protein n=1 Tax=Ostreobium quekettii TaxID=121088 RepID=A0A8S1JAV1_9CHLO|nr:unnamed protein product [Ostreobium quekettii]
MADAKGVNVNRTAGLLGLFSAFLLVEGVIRVALVLALNHDSDEDPNADWDGMGGDTFPEWLRFVGALLEVAAGVAGLGLALGVMAFDYHSAAITGAGVMLMLSLWFTFVVFVFAQPAFDASKLDASRHDDLTLGQWRGVVTLGIIGSAGYCGALQGGQVFFAWQLWRIGAGDASQYTKPYYAARLVYYSTLALLAGVSQLAIGIFIRDEVGEGRLEGPQRVGAPPYFIAYPELNIAAGLLVTFASLAGYVRAVAQRPSGRLVFAWLWACTWMVQVLFMAVTQLGLWSTGTPLERTQRVFVSGMLVGLTLSVSILPPYMDAMMHSPDAGASPGGDSKMSLMPSGGA